MLAYRCIYLMLIAAQYLHLDLARCLVKELGADVDQADVKGSTTLHVVAHMTATWQRCGGGMSTSRIQCRRRHARYVVGLHLLSYF